MEKIQPIAMIELDKRHECYRINLTVVKERMDSYLTIGRYEHKLDLDRLTFTGQLSKDFGREVYGWGALYTDMYHVELDKAESIVKTLRTIKRGMDKRDPRNFAEWLMAACAVLKIKDVVVRYVEKDFNGRGYVRFEKRTVANLPSIVERMIDDTGYKDSERYTRQ